MRSLFVLALAAAAATELASSNCQGRSNATKVENTPVPNPASGVAATLQINKTAAGVEFIVTVKNSGPQAVTLFFSSSERVRVIVRDSTGTQLWDSSGGKFFAQMIGEVQLAAGASTSFKQVWKPGPGTHGTLTAAGEVCSKPALAIEPTEFTLP